MHLLVSDVRAARHVEMDDELESSLIRESLPPHICFSLPLHVKIQAQLSGANILVSGKITALASMNCACCLIDFKQPLHFEFQQVFDTQTEEIDLTKDIKEAILIDLPIKTVCKKDCRGLCPHCGVNRNTSVCQCMESNTDPRWDTLKRFQIK